MDTKISCEDGQCVRNIRNASGGANLVPAAAVIPDPGPYVAAGTVKAFDPVDACRPSKPAGAGTVRFTGQIWCQQPR